MDELRRGEKRKGEVIQFPDRTHDGCYFLDDMSREALEDRAERAREEIREAEEVLAGCLRRLAC